MLTREAQGECTARREPYGYFLEPHQKKVLLPSNRFPFSNFTYFLTLFSKFFSSFPHGTCSLSVSRHYLALDEIYHPFRAAFPSNPTLVGSIIVATRSIRPKYGIVTLSDVLSKGLIPNMIPAEKPLQNYNSRSIKAFQISNLSFSRFTRRY